MTIPAIPDLIERDPATIEAEVLSDLETKLGKILQPAQVEALLGSVFAYRESLVRMAIQDAGLQTFVAFARAPMLDYLGELVGTDRLAAVAATTTLHFILAAAQGAPVVIPAGTRVQSNDRQQVFETSKNLTIGTGETTGDVEAAAAVEGEAANGYLADAITQLLDPIATVASVANTTTSAGGADLEADDPYRERIREAPNKFSVAGSADAYRYYALSVSTHIIDAGVTTPEPGVVRVYILTDDGLPGVELLADVLAALSDKKVRPLTDTVEVEAPDEVPFTIDATVRLLSGTDIDATLAAVEAAADAYAADRRAGLGRDIVPSQIIQALSLPGVYQVTLAAPAFAEVDPSEWANCGDITITLGAPAEG